MNVSTQHKGSFWNQYIMNRIQNNKNFVCAITGQTGSGKSWSAVRLGEVLDPEFDVRNICFTSREFMDLVNGKTKKLKRGSVIVFDEVQVSMSHLDYQSLQAKVLNYVFQTFRHRNFILFMTSPHFSFINASLRKLFHSRMETVAIDHNKKLCKLKPFLIQVNQRTGDSYFKYLRVYRKGLGLAPIKSVGVGMPSKELIKEYEDKKTRFTMELNDSIQADLNKLENKGKPEAKPLTEIQERIVTLLLDNKTLEEVAKEMGNNPRYITAQMNFIRKKGVTITPVKEKGKNKVLYYNIEGI